MDEDLILLLFPIYSPFSDYQNTLIGREDEKPSRNIYAFKFGEIVSTSFKF